MINNPQPQMNNNDLVSAIGKQQLLIKTQLSQSNTLVAKQQLAIKSALAEQKSANTAGQL